MKMTWQSPCHHGTWCRTPRSVLPRVPGRCAQRPTPRADETKTCNEMKGNTRHDPPDMADEIAPGRGSRAAGPDPGAGTRGPASGPRQRHRPGHHPELRLQPANAHG